MPTHPRPAAIGGAARPLAATVLCLVAALLAACAAPPTRAPESAERSARGEDARPPAARAADPSLHGDYLPAEVATVGWDALANSPVVLLREETTGKMVPIWVGITEARAIAAALEEISFPRPMTHDLMANLLDRLDARVEELVIHDLVDGTYYALLALRPHRAEGEPAGEPILVDTRPSDGMALALRLEAPIRIARKLLDQVPDNEFLAPEESDQVVRAFGLTVVAPTAELRERFSLPDRPGVVVTRATGEAERKGLRRGDLVVEVAGVSLREPVDFLDAVRRAPPDRPIPVTYWRDGAEHETELNPAEREEGEAGPKQVV